MVLSACSPYFQALFVNHPEKHPIVILKDVPFADMKSLLDFMYRGEVSVDQERLSAFLRVAESLRIKGLTEVNDEKSTSSSRDQSETPPTTQNRVHPYVLQQQQQQRKVLQQQQQQSSQQSQQSTNNPLLGTALSMPKRKRGRPRKLSGSDDVEDYDDDYRENLLQVEKRRHEHGKWRRVFIVLFACCCRNHRSYWKSKWEQKTTHRQTRTTIVDAPMTMMR